MGSYSPEKEKLMIVCNICGDLLEPNYKFCPKCGTPNKGGTKVAVRYVPVPQPPEKPSIWDKLLGPGLIGVLVMIGIFA